MSALDERAIVVEVLVTPRGYRRVLTHLAVRPLRWVAPVVAFAGFGALGGGRTNEGLVVLVGLAGVFVVIWGYVTYMSRSPAVAVVYAPVRYEFDDSGVRYAGDEGSGEFPWSAVARWRVAADHYLLYVGGSTYLLVPADAFEPAEEMRFAALLREHVPKGPRNA